MKGIKTFANQTEGMKYFTILVTGVANRGWFQTDEVKNLFCHEVESWGGQYDRHLAQFWGLVCLPILKFFEGVVEGGDSAMGCDFRHDIKETGDRSHGYSWPVAGSLAWYGQATQGRFVRLVFEANGSCRMFYDTGYRRADLNNGEEEWTPEGDANMIPKGKSLLLNVPSEGDEDFSAMSKEGFYALVHEAAEEVKS